MNQNLYQHLEIPLPIITPTRIEPKPPIVVPLLGFDGFNQQVGSIEVDSNGKVLKDGLPVTEYKPNLKRLENKED